MSLSIWLLPKLNEKMIIVELLGLFDPFYVFYQNPQKHEGNFFLLI